MNTSRILSAISFGIIVFGQGCSGKFAPIGSDQGDASVQGGGSGIGGSTGVTCLYNNVHYAVGASFKSSDGCNSCSCSSNGQALCTLMACVGTGGGSGVGGATSVGCVCSGPSPASPTMQCWDGSTAGPTCAQHADGTCNWTVTTCPPQPGVGGGSGVGGTTGVTCLYNNVNYAAGSSFKSSDGCNTCSCTSSGHIACTTMACVNPGTGGATGVGGSTSVACPPIALIVPKCSNGTAILQHDPSTGCATGYACPTCPTVNLPNITCANYQLVTDPTTGCPTGYTCPVADASVCPPIALVFPVCANGSAVLKYDASGCATGYACP